MDFEPVRKARLTQGEFAKLCGVSRVTANTWLSPNRKVQPHRLLTAVVTHQLLRVQEALAAGDLPLPGTVTRDEREDRIRKVLASAGQRIRARLEEHELS